MRTLSILASFIILLIAVPLAASPLDDYEAAKKKLIELIEGSSNREGGGSSVDSEIKQDLINVQTISGDIAGLSVTDALKLYDSPNVAGQERLHSFIVGYIAGALYMFREASPKCTNQKNLNIEYASVMGNMRAAARQNQEKAARRKFYLSLQRFTRLSMKCAN